MKSLNRVQLMGYLGRDPELRATDSGSVLNLSLATSVRYKDRESGEGKQKTDWHNIVAFNGTADLMAQFLHVGSPVLVEGRLHTRKWQDKDGQDQYSTEVVVEDFYALEKRAEPVAGQAT